LTIQVHDWLNRAGLKAARLGKEGFSINASKHGPVSIRPPNTSIGFKYAFVPAHLADQAKSTVNVHHFGCLDRQHVLDGSFQFSPGTGQAGKEMGSDLDHRAPGCF
jgi:hypothetical protein